jgi:hypothetical protein
MERIWITTAELRLQPEDVPQGSNLGFMRVCMWASSREDFLRKLEAYCSRYEWKILSTENTEAVEDTSDYGDEINQIIEEVSQDPRAIRLGTFYSYKPN